MPDTGEGEPREARAPTDPLERDVATAVWGRLAHERLACCPALLDMAVVRGVLKASSGEATAVEAASFVLRRTLQERRGDLWSAARALAGIDPPLIDLQARRRAASHYLRQRGSGPASPRTTRRYEHLVWTELARTLRALGERPDAIRKLAGQFDRRGDLPAPISNLSPADLENDRADERPVIVAAAQSAVFVDDDRFKTLLRVTRVLVAQRDEVNLIGFEVRYEGGNDALTPRVLRGGEFLPEPAISETPMGYRRYQVALSRTLSRGDRHELEYEIPISRETSTQQKTMTVSAFDSDQLPGFTLTMNVHFTGHPPRRVVRAVAPSARWPRYAASRQPLAPRLTVATVFQESECAAGQAVGLYWEW